VEIIYWTKYNQTPFATKNEGSVKKLIPSVSLSFYYFSLEQKEGHDVRGLGKIIF
jgi:hypothetical protein